MSSREPPITAPHTQASQHNGFVLTRRPLRSTNNKEDVWIARVDLSAL